MSSLARSEITVENCMLSAPTHGYCSYKSIRKRPYCMNRAFAHAHQDSETHKKTSGLQTIRTIARIQFATHVQVQSVIIHNQIQCTHSVSSSQVSLYGPPLNQLCQDDLPRTSNIPLYQSQVPFSGVHLLNHARMTYTSTMKCPARYLALYSSTLLPRHRDYISLVTGQRKESWSCGTG